MNTFLVIAGVLYLTAMLFLLIGIALNLKSLVDILDDHRHTVGRLHSDMQIRGLYFNDYRADFKFAHSHVPKDDAPGTSSVDDIADRMGSMRSCDAGID